jgi:hypothetical protein
VYSFLVSLKSTSTLVSRAATAKPYRQYAGVAHRQACEDYMDVEHRLMVAQKQADCQQQEPAVPADAASVVPRRNEARKPGRPNTGTQMHAALTHEPEAGCA